MPPPLKAMTTRVWRVCVGWVIFWQTADQHLQCLFSDTQRVHFQNRMRKKRKKTSEFENKCQKISRETNNPCGKASDHIWDTQHCKGSISRKEVMRLMSSMESRLITNFLFGLITIMVSFHVYTPVCVCCVHAIIPQV